MKRTVIFFLILTFFGNLFAGTTGKITGRVVDASDGSPLLGANIILEGTIMGAACDQEGNFLILNVAPGTYDLVVTMIGYTKQIVKDVNVQIDLTTRIDFNLTTQAVKGEAVTVIASRPAVQKDLTSSEARISSNDIEKMPVNNMGDILQLQSGVTQDAGGGIHIRGGRSSEVAYWVDGLPVTDSYDGGQAVSVENAAIQELQVISGTFNAEYGNAMSGIVNIVTKEGAQDYEGSVSIYGGDYITSDKDLYPGIEKINPTSERDLQVNFSGPVPLTNKKASFYTNARYNYSDGWLYGQKYFNIYGDTLSTDNPDFVPINWNQRLTTHSKLSFRLFSKLKVALSYMTSDDVYENFNHGLQYTPDANMERHNKGRNASLKLTHSLSNKTFYDLSFSQYSKNYHHRYFESENNSGYIDPYYWDHIERENPYYWFTDHSIDLGRFFRETNTQIAKFDLTSQVTKHHLVKLGAELKYHNLELDGYSIVDDPNVSDSVFTPYIPKKDVEGKKFGEFGRDFYSHSPKEFSLYIQDKIEFKSVIINLGLRYDYFDANTVVPKDLSEPYIDNPRDPLLDSLTLAEKEEFWWKETSVKQQFSPRLGIAYPITDKGVLHFSFGHFFQIPNFELLYTYPGYKIPETSGQFGIGGNPDLNPQKTVMYELGMNQEVIKNLTVDLTGFYRDIRDWVSTGVSVDIGGGAEFITYANKDYSNVMGVILSLEKKYSNNFWFNLSYTFQIAEGSHSNPGDAFGAFQANQEPRKYLIPLEWDQTQTLNSTFFYGVNGYGISLIGRFGTGIPYTPVILTATRQGANVSVQPEENSRRKPKTYEMDLKLNKNITFLGNNVEIFVDIYNFLDIRNQINVWGSTGNADKGLEELKADEASRNHLSENRINTVEEFFTHQEWYSAPRKINIGIRISF